MAVPAPSSPARRTITIVLADDHEIVRAAVQALLDAVPDLEVVDDVADAIAAVRSVVEHGPAVLVLDLGLRGESAPLDAIRQVLLHAPDTAVVVLTMHRDLALARRALGLGALGYVLKASADTELVEAVRRAAAGARYVTPALAASASEPGACAELTARECEVLRSIALGHTNREIAERLALSVRTVESHRAQVQRKLGRRKRAELVRYALDHHLLDGA